MSFGEAHITTLDEAGRHSHRGRTENSASFLPCMVPDEDGAPNTYFPLGEDMGMDIPTQGVVVS
jgi:hypothetical protein